MEQISLKRSFIDDFKRRRTNIKKILAAIKVLDNYNVGKKIEITDIEIAKSILVDSPDIWEYLSDELKNNQVLIYYYQPIGFLTLCIFNRKSTNSSDYYKDSEELCCQKGFIKKGDIQIPNIKSFPSEFNLEKYEQIQRKLLEDAITFSKKDFNLIYNGRDQYDLGKKIGEVFEINDFFKEQISETSFPLIESITLFDRSKLEKIINENDKRKNLRFEN